jgi:hypothetical protein
VAGIHQRIDIIMLLTTSTAVLREVASLGKINDSITIAHTGDGWLRAAAFSRTTLVYMRVHALAYSNAGVFSCSVSASTLKRLTPRAQADMAQVAVELVPGAEFPEWVAPFTPSPAPATASLSLAAVAPLFATAPEYWFFDTSHSPYRASATIQKTGSEWFALIAPVRGLHPLDGHGIQFHTDNEGGIHVS